MIKIDLKNKILKQINKFNKHNNFFAYITFEKRTLY